MPSLGAQMLLGDIHTLRLNRVWTFKWELVANVRRRINGGWVAKKSKIKKKTSNSTPVYIILALTK